MARASVVVPVRNGARFVAAALASVREQAHVAEVIVVDDGSSDDSARVVAATAEVRLIACSARGAGAARNVGVREASGEFIAFLDADDLWLPDKLSLQLERLATVGARALCVCAFEQFVEPGYAPPLGLRAATLGRPLRAPLPSALVLRRETFLDIGPFREDLATAEDVEWFGRAKAAGVAFELVESVLFRKRIHDANTSLVTPGNSDRLLRVLAARTRGARA